ncbi:patatin-like phospholipase family protein [Marinobacteraceae bacterium S3BR75-40.1]
MPDLSRVRNVVFAGGGNRCFWQLGFWKRVARETGLAPRQMASVSAGSAMACTVVAERIDETVELTCEALSRNARNQYWSHLWQRGERVFPHEGIYRGLIRQLLDETGLARIRKGPENRIEITRIPPWLGARTATALGLSAYQAEKRWHHPVHPVAGQRLGFVAEFVAARCCDSPQALEDLILASSCTPPFTRLARINGRVALDGGLVDNVPVAGLNDPEAPTLVLLTRPYKRVPESPQRLYLRPSQPVPVAAWDYTDADGVRATLAQGEADGEAFLRQLDSPESLKALNWAV